MPKRKETVALFCLASAIAVVPVVSRSTGDIEGDRARTEETATFATTRDRVATSETAATFNEFPTSRSTGPRVTPTATVGPLATSSDGQVVEGVIVNGQLTIVHDNAIVRDVVVMGDRTYMIRIDEKDNDECPSNV